MSTRIRFRLIPTFPLDADELKRLKRRRILESPTMAATCSAATLVDWLASSGVPVVSTIAKVCGGWLSDHWREQSERLDASVIQEIIDSSNRNQDAELQRVMRMLRSNGYHQYAICLGQFLLLKQRVESELQAGASVARKQEELETLVDSICASVCEQIVHLIDKDGQLADALTSSSSAQLESLEALESEAHERIRKAYATLMRTTEKLDTILAPGERTSDAREAEMKQLDRLIDQLREENDIADRVDDQLRRIDQTARGGY